MTKAQPEQWKASCDGPPWTHTTGSHANANRSAKEMRTDGFSWVRVYEWELVEVGMLKPEVQKNERLP